MPTDSLVARKNWNSKITLNEKKIDIALISETHMKPSNQLKICNYDTHRKDRKIKKGGGVAIMIEKSIKHEELPEMKQEDRESTGIQLVISESNTRIYSTYISPSNNLNEKELDEMLKNDTPRIISYIGDLNAKNKVWYSKTTNVRGRKLEKIIENRQLTAIGLMEPTHYQLNTTPDLLDIAITKNITTQIDCYNEHKLTSDHTVVGTPNNTNHKNNRETKNNKEDKLGKIQENTKNKNREDFIIDSSPPTSTPNLKNTGYNHNPLLGLPLPSYLQKKT
jgi:hypothetical protein